MKYFDKFPTFRFNDARLLLIKHGASEEYARKFISLMVKNGHAYRIKKGYYTLHRDMDVVGFAFKPFYYGLGTALNFYNLTEQQYNQILITPNNVRSGVRTIFGQNVSVFRIPRELFFGYIRAKGSQFPFYVSDIEKTLIDSIYYKFVFEDYVYRNIVRNIIPGKLNKYLKAYNKSIKDKTTFLLHKYKK